MKTLELKDGSQLNIGESPEDNEKLISECPNPFYANKTRELTAELKALDPDLTVELLLEPGDVAIVYVRDTSIFPPRVQSWKLTRKHMGFDRWAQDYAQHLMQFWTRARERRNAC